MAKRTTPIDEELKALCRKFCDESGESLAQLARTMQVYPKTFYTWLATEGRGMEREHTDQVVWYLRARGYVVKSIAEKGGR